MGYRLTIQKMDGQFGVFGAALMILQDILKINLEFLAHPQTLEVLGAILTYLPYPLKKERVQEFLILQQIDLTEIE